jgi:hypothetical protein
MLARTQIAALVLALVILGGCGDSGGDKKDGGSSEPASKPAQGTTFKASDVNFTFQYPKGFQQVDEPNDGQVLATVTSVPNDVNNALKIRETASKELPFASYGSKLRSQFEAQLGTKVSQREITQGGLAMGVLEWKKPYTKTDLGEEKTFELHSTSYFFAGGAKTWQIECLSAQDHRREIEAACRKAIASIEFP